MFDEGIAIDGALEESSIEELPGQVKFSQML